MARGRFFSKNFPTDPSNYVINEAAAKAMGLESPVEKRFSYTGQMAGRMAGSSTEGIIIGVIKDFHQESLHHPIKPLVFKIWEHPMDIFVRVDPNHVPEALDFLKTKWQEFVDIYPFMYKFLDEELDGLYKSEQKFGSIFKDFTYLAIFIACLGLLGLASFMAEQKKKEIGIRKVMGATLPNLVQGLSKEFVRWIIVAAIIGSPAAWYLMKQWLQNFTYRANMAWWMFLLAIGLVVTVTLLTVGYQIIKTARANPVDSLRCE
jgi:putative ABC transport system permease protein